MSDRHPTDWNPPAPEVIQEPFTIVLWGVTNKSLADWAAVQEILDPEKITELTRLLAALDNLDSLDRMDR